MTCRTCGVPVPDGARYCPSCGVSVQLPGEERRVVTTLFADIVGFTGFAEGIDPERVKNVVDGCFERLAADVTAHGGRVDKIVGDAIVALFGAPVAHEDDAERAVRAALQMQRTVNDFASEVLSGIQMRIGVNTGEVLVGALRAGGDYTAMGDVMNIADRLQSCADPGQVLVGPATYAATRNVIRYEVRGPVRARGREAPIEAWEAREPLGLPGTRPHRARTPLIGRKAELGMLWHALGTAFDHRRPHLVLLMGEAGVGKTRLVEEAAEVARVQHNALVLEGRCLPYGEANVWWPVAEALRQAFSIEASDAAEAAVEKVRTTVADLVGRTGEGAEAARVSDGLLYLMGYVGQLGDMDPTRARDEAIRALQDCLQAFARGRPLVIVLSELHWADDLVLELIDRSFERLRELPIVLVATARPEVEDRWSPKPGRHNLIVLNLDPLDREAAAQLLGVLLGAEPTPEVLSTVLDRSGGNPLFLEELAALIGESSLPKGEAAELPATLRGLVAARLDALPADERSALEDAAVIGRSGSREGLRALVAARGAADPDAVLDALTAKDLLSIDGVFAFKSDLVRDVAYETLTKGERARRHAALGEWLAEYAERTDRVSEFLERIAHHYGAAAELVIELGPVAGVSPNLRERALKWLERAARSAIERETMGVSAHLFDHALRLVEDPEGPEARELLLGRAKARRALRDMAGARADAGEAKRRAGTAGDEAGVARALNVLGGVATDEGSSEEAKEILEEAVALWRTIGDRRGEADALRLYGMAQMFGGELDAAEATIAEALDAARSIGDRRCEAWALQNLAWVSFMRGEHDVAEKRLEGAQQLFADLGDFGGQGWALGLLGYVRYFKGDLPYAEGIAQIGIEWTSEMGDRWAHGMMVTLLAAVRLWQGGTEEAVELGLRASALFDEIDDDLGRMQSLMALVWAYTLTGRCEEARKGIERSIAVAARMPTWRQVVWCTASNVAAVTGDAERALACTSEAESFDTAGLASAQNALARALALLQLGRTTEAEETAEAVFGLDLDPGERSYANAIATLTRAAAGRLEDAVAAAESLGPQDGSYLDRVRAHMGRGLAYAQLGRRFACRGAFDAALEIVDGTSDQLHQALVRLARGLAFESLGMPESGEGVTGAREKLRRLGVVHDGWDVALRLCVGSAEHAAG